MAVYDHSYYYQLQGQLGLSVLSWIDFVAHSGVGDILKQQVFPDKDMWSKSMVPKLNHFISTMFRIFFLLNELKLVNMEELLLYNRSSSHELNSSKHSF